MNNKNKIALMLLCLSGVSYSYANATGDELSFYAECVAKNTFEHTVANNCVADALSFEKSRIQKLFTQIQSINDAEQKLIYKHVIASHKLWKAHTDYECKFQGKFFDSATAQYCYLNRYQQQANDLIKHYEP